MTPNESEFLHEATEAIELNDSERLANAVSGFSSFCFKETPPLLESPPFSEDFVSGVVKLMERKSLLEMDESFPLFGLFQSDWGRLDSVQRIELCKFLETIYNKLHDNTAPLVIVELIGEYLADSYSLEALERLSAAPNEVARAHVAHGFKCLAQNGIDSGLRAKAVERLRAMVKDSSKVVRKEAAADLADVSP